MFENTAEAGEARGTQTPELVEEELLVVTRTATGLVLKDRVRGSGFGRFGPPATLPLDPIPPPAMAPGCLAAVVLDAR